MKILTNLIVPTIAILLIYAGRKQSRALLIRVTIALGWAYLLHFVDRAFGIWKGFDLDYSTHTAVAIALGTSLARLGRTWMAAALALWIAYAILMIHMGYHTLADILTTAGANLPIAIAAQFAGRRQSA